MALILGSKNRTLIVKFSGELDLVSAKIFREKVDEALEEMYSKNLLLDLSKVTFIDSSGLGAILGRFRRIKDRQGQMIIFGPSLNVKKILELAGILAIIPTVTTENDAWLKLDERYSNKEA